MRAIADEIAARPPSGMVDDVKSAMIAENCTANIAATRA